MMTAAPARAEPSPQEVVEGLRALDMKIGVDLAGDVYLFGPDEKLIQAAWVWLARREPEIVAYLEAEPPAP